MMIEMVVTVPGRHGTYLGGEIESGVVQIGDHLVLMEDGKRVGEITCDGFGSIDRIAGTERCLVAVYSAASSSKEVRPGQVLVGTQLRRPGDAAPPASMSAPLYRRQTAAATGFASQHAPRLISQAHDGQRQSDSDCET
jgi:hypothetical protein